MRSRSLVGVAGTVLLATCGTSCQMADIAEPELRLATKSSAHEVPRAIDPREPASMAVNDFESVVVRIEPIAEAVCREQTPAGKQKDCDFDIRVDRDPHTPNNAFQTVGLEGQPLIIVTAALLVGARNEHEIAFVLGHEAGHHIADHLKRLRLQQLAGSLLLDLAAAAAGASDAYDPRAQQVIEDAMSIGAAVAGPAFSQTFELEADMLGAFIAERAGFDPELGSRIFVRHETVKGPDRAMSLWSTHPQSSQRIAIVSKAVEEIRNQRSAGQTPRPRWSSR